MALDNRGDREPHSAHYVQLPASGIKVMYASVLDKSHAGIAVPDRVPPGLRAVIGLASVPGRIATARQPRLAIQAERRVGTRVGE
ncbi:hypothetical protein ACFMQL_24810 [Nonomuraea fastidiosa]|uniref:hypothetical protein n=1 Tax=Nonomuraea fastidiosa TaxID=46173 RepID=UPI00366E9CFD